MAMDCSMEYQLSNNAKPCQGKVINLSGKGILFISSDEVQVGDSISFKLTPENTITPSMSADILVTRCDQLSDNEYEIAAEIVQIR
ncbi:MAG: PilZ domain-containing protein [Gammaproteobacteria bacterium]|nr:PilZ domain-containing protein [Gammaproteobacteria bacterium]